MIDKKRLETKLKEIFQSVGHLDVRPPFVGFTCDSNQCSLKNLNALSELLGTDAINFQGREEEYRYSSWTSDTERYGQIECFDVNLDRLEELLA